VFDQARDSGDAQVALMEQYDADRDTLFERTYATVVQVPPSHTDVAAGSSSLRDCSNIEIRVGANMSRADLTGANMTDAHLTGSEVADANLSNTTCADTTWVDGTLVPGPRCPPTATAI
jgi:hypothetical protein